MTRGGAAALGTVLCLIALFSATSSGPRVETRSLELSPGADAATTAEQRAVVAATQATGASSVVGVADAEAHRASPSGIVTTRKNWFTRLWDSIWSCIAGFFLFFFTFAVLMANEGNYVTRKKTVSHIEESLKLLLTRGQGLPAFGVTPPTPLQREQLGDPLSSCSYGGEGGPVCLHYAHGRVETVTLVDELFGLRTNGLRLRRTVELFQYYEDKESKTEKDTVGGGETTTTTYTLHQGWFTTVQPLSGNAPGSENIHQASFPHFGGEEVRSKTYDGSLHLDGCHLSAAQVASLRDWENVPSEVKAGSSPEGAEPYLPAQSSLYMPAPSAPPLPQDYGTMGAPAAGAGSGSQARAGDVRISWEYVDAGQYSVLCGRQGNLLTEYEVVAVPPYTLPCICIPFTCCGLGSLLINAVTSTSNKVDMIRRGVHSPRAMVDTLKSGASFWVWFLRGLGFVMFAASVSMILSPLPTLLDLIGFVGSVARFGTTVISLAVALILTPLVVAACWLTYRPLYALCIAVPPMALYWYFSTLSH